MSSLKNTTITYKARYYVYEGGGIKELPDDVIGELSRRHYMIGQSERWPGDTGRFGLGVRHSDHAGRYFLNAGDALIFIDDDSVQEFESVKV